MNPPHQAGAPYVPGQPQGIVPGGKRGAGFWILIGVGCLGAGGVVLVGGLILLGVLAGISEGDGGPGAVKSASPGPVSDAGGSSSTGEPDDFIYKSTTSGLEYIAENHVSAEGVSVTLAGVWREDHRNVVLRLREGGRYELSAGGGAIAGRTKYDTVASTSAEQGTWTFEGATLTLTPDQYDLSGIAEGKSNSGKGKADGPRQWNVVGVTIEYKPNGSDTFRQRPGLRINGPGPSWYYPPGNWNWVLRSAR